MKVEEVDEKGKKKKKLEKVSKIDKENLYLVSPYARFFDECSLYYTKDSEANKLFLLSVQDKLNQKLKKKGYLYLNDVYQALGLQESKALSKAGWIYNEIDNEGDNYVDFGLYNQTGVESIDEPKRRFEDNSYGTNTIAAISRVSRRRIEDDNDGINESRRS